MVFRDTGTFRMSTASISHGLPMGVLTSGARTGDGSLDLWQISRS